MSVSDCQRVSVTATVSLTLAVSVSDCQPQGVSMSGQQRQESESPWCRSPGPVSKATGRQSPGQHGEDRDHGSEIQQRKFESPGRAGPAPGAAGGSGRQQHGHRRESHSSSYLDCQCCIPIIPPAIWLPLRSTFMMVQLHRPEWTLQALPRQA